MPERKRNRVLEAIRGEPGLGVRALARATGMATDTISKHAKVLVEEGHVTRLACDGALLHYPADASPGRIEVLLDHQPALRDLLDHLDTVGPVTQPRIVEWGQSMGWARSTTQARMKRLLVEGLVLEKQVDGVTCYASSMTTTPASTALGAIQPAP